MADIVHSRLVEATDLRATWEMGLGADVTHPSFIPIHYPTDHECLERILPTCGRLDVYECSIVWIRNTMALGEIANTSFWLTDSV